MSENTKQTSPIRFYKNVDKTSSCWNWQGYRYTFLYKDKKHILPHIYSYMLYFGSENVPKKVWQTCLNNRCVNPIHLQHD